MKDSDRFDVLKKKTLTFADEFEGDKLDTDKWLTNYYWGDKLLKDRYSVEGDLQAYTERDNFEIRNSLLRIHTKPQRITGKVWSPDMGFRTREFSYTSGIINSGISFRQKYGIFTAKIKLGNPDARNTFWMLAGEMTPHIDICRTSGGKVWADFSPSPQIKLKTPAGSRYARDFYIFSLEWTSSMLVWKINGEVLFRQTSNIPQEPMYVLLSGGTEKPLSGMSTMEIDWVRIYQFS
jgi:beta-glucanase (GH16 family)